MTIDQTSPETTAVPDGSFVLRIWRGDASGGEFCDYAVPQLEGEVVLDVVHRIQAEAAPDLAVRWNCKAGKCGSCSAEINGQPRLMCMTRMSSLDTSEPVTVSPMRTFPVMRDLVTDVSFNFEMAKRIPPFTPAPRPADGVYRMSQFDVDRAQEFHKCIECFLCQNVCHVIRDHEENKTNYAGPRYFVRLAELEMHPLDTLDRRDLMSKDLAIGLCNITKCCTEVCPESIHITDNAIIPLKERVVDARFDPIAWLGRKFLRRPDPTSADAAAALSPAAHTGRCGTIGLTGPTDMVRFLSEEWFARFSEELGRLQGDPTWPPLDIGQEIVDTPDGTVRYTIHVTGGKARLSVGTLDGASATLVENYETAKAIASGSSISELLSKGRITVRGDAKALVSAQAPLAALAGALGELAGATEV